MTIDQLLASLRADNTKALEKRAEHTIALADLRADEANGKPVDETKIEAIRTAKTAIDAEVTARNERIVHLEAEKRADEAATVLSGQIVPTGASRPAYDQVARVGQEPVTYSELAARDNVSFFVDAYRFVHLADPHSRERLERHSREAGSGVTQRATTTSSFGGLIVPQYLVDQAALIARTGRPTANIVTKLPLPSQGTSFVIPRGTTGASAAIQATENSAVSSTDEVWANVTVPMVTIAGQQDVSRQSLERGTPGIDQLVYLDLAGAYAAALDTQVIAGSGSSGQMLGIYNTASVNQASAFGAAATVATFYTKVGGQLNAVETTRYLAPTVIVMHPRRWNWLLTQLDSSNRPLVVPNAFGPTNALALAESPLVDTISAMAVGYLFGLPVITDANVQTSQGSGPEDIVYVMRAQDLLLWEDGDGMPRELRFEQTLGGQLTVKLVCYGYSAFTAGRYPAAVGLVGGNGASGFGLVAPTF